MADDREPSKIPSVSFAELLARMEDDWDLLRDLVGIFHEEFPGALQSLQMAAERGDFKAIENCAHGLKGMLATLAFGPASDLAKRIEQMGRDRISEDVPELLATLEREANAAVRELELFCAGPAK